MVRLFLDEPHYVLLTGVKDGSILLFDPYYWDEPYEEKDILIDLEHPRAYNRKCLSGISTVKKTSCMPLEK